MNEFVLRALKEKIRVKRMEVETVKSELFLLEKELEKTERIQTRK